jgi:hypothetical protein
MLNYTVSRVTGQPDWETIPTLSMDNRYLETTKAVQAWAQIAYNQEAFLVHLSIRTPEIRAVEFGPLGMPCEDSCLEFFFRPDPEDTRYFNIEFNPNGCLYLGFGNQPGDLVRLIPEHPPIIPEVRRTEDGWMVTYAIPYHFIRQFFPAFRPVSGGCIRANCYKCGDLTPNPHFLVWNPVDPEREAFHVPELFGLMRFE